MAPKMTPAVRRMIGGRIYEQRRRERLPASDLAALLGVPRSSVTDWEKGRWLPNLVVFWALAEVLGVPIEQLVGPADGWRFRPLPPSEGQEGEQHAESLRVVRG